MFSKKNYVAEIRASTLTRRRIISIILIEIYLNYESMKTMNSWGNIFDTHACVCLLRNQCCMSELKARQGYRHTLGRSENFVLNIRIVHSDKHAKIKSIHLINRETCPTTVCCRITTIHWEDTTNCPPPPPLQHNWCGTGAVSKTCCVGIQSILLSLIIPWFIHRTHLYFYTRYAVVEKIC